MIDPLIQEKISRWRQKAIDKTITVEELKDAILTMREARRTAGDANAKSGKGKSKKPVKDADTMLDELEKL